MNRWRWAGVVVVVAAVSVGVNAYGGGAGTKVTWQAFDKIDKPFYQEMTTETTQTMKVQGQDVVQKQTQTFYIEWTPKKKEGGNYTVQQKIVGVKMNINIGGNNIDFDSTKGANQPANPLTDFFKALVDSTFTLTISEKDLKVTNVEGLDKFVDRLAATNDQLKPLLKSILTQDALKQMSDPTFAAFPKDGKLDPKAPWKHQVILNMGPIGTYDTTYTFTPQAKVNTILDVTATMSYAPPKDKDSAGLPFVIKSGELKADKATGTVTIDEKAGRVASSEMTVEMSGKLVIDISGMTTDVELRQKQTSKLTTSDTNPMPKAK